MSFLHHYHVVLQSRRVRSEFTINIKKESNDPVHQEMSKTLFTEYTGPIYYSPDENGTK